MFPFMTRRVWLFLLAEGLFGPSQREGDMAKCESCEGRGRLYYEGGRYSVVCGPCDGQGEVRLRRCVKCRKLVQVFSIGKV